MASPFAQYLGTNYCPTDAEVLEIKNLIVRPIRQLLSLDEEIAQLRKSIEKLEESREILSSYVAEHSALISPIRRIPEDVLSEIFFACLPTHRNCVMSASEAPVLLGRICSLWRAVSLATPRLWASLHIVEPRNNAANKLIQRFDATKMWLGRSGRCPLSISIHWENFNVIPLYRHAEQAEMLPSPPDLLMNELIPFAGRWKHVKFVTSRAAFQVLAQIAVTDVPMLESIVVYLQNGHHSTNHNADWTQYGIFNGPCVSSFSTLAQEFKDSIPLRWSLLTELVLTGPHWESSLDDEKALQTLSRCPQLRICELSINIPSFTPLQHPPVELLQLDSLKLELGDMNSLFLTRLFVPNLRNFVLQGPVNSLPPFLASCERLETFDVGISQFDKASLSEVFCALSPQTMHHLALRDHGWPQGMVSSYPFDDDILAMFAPGRDSQCCLPSLQTLTVVAGHEISDRALQQFVVSRMTMAGTGGYGAPSSLKRIRVQFYRPMKLDIKAGLQLFLDEGLEIETRYMPLPPTPSPWMGLPDAPHPARPPPTGYPVQW
ncbi:hypothetical protein R3P38DRAFT_3048501 [Favolaschia claudopus]|uniref:F-box domain-containing protein n=1 Tax=Favolaschia claudopus TaxID=2862362 RepID=A0AAW0A618_9AGAR